MIERRNHPRVDASHAVIYFGDVYPGPKVASTLDLSLGGARIETPYGLKKGEKLEMAIAIHPQVIKCIAHVVSTMWPDGDRLKAGVRFEEIPGHDRHYLDEHISSLIEHQEKEANGEGN